MEPVDHKKQQSEHSVRLGRQLWRAADVLRGIVDPTAYRLYILSLLFLKRFCDVAEAGQSPLGTQGIWARLMAQEQQIGRAVDKAFQALSQLGHELSGLFDGVLFDQPGRFSDELMAQLLSIFDALKLGTNEAPSSVLGDAYEYLLARFASDAGRKGGEFYTPRGIVRLLVALVEPAPGHRIYDPSCGAGALLIGCQAALGKDQSLQLFGQERNPTSHAMARLSLLMQDADPRNIALGDTLLNPAHVQKDSTLQTFDRIVGNPPFSLKNWGYGQWAKGDAFCRDRWGTPPKNYGDWAFVCHMLCALAPNGKMAVVVPHGVLFRGGAEARIRRSVLEEGWLEAVVGVAPNLFYGTSIPAAILIFSKNEKSERKNRVVVVNAAACFRSGRATNELTNEHITQLVSCVKQPENWPELSRSVTLDEIREQDYNLNITRYVGRAPMAKPLDINTQIEKLREKVGLREIAERKFFEVMDQEG